MTGPTWQERSIAAEAVRGLVVWLSQQPRHSSYRLPSGRYRLTVRLH
ncbi:hypothetical protein [Streptomyces montanus]|nr:hypothetical protein [Streptomyces montanus]